MSPPIDQRLLDAIVTLTGQREQETLASALVDAVSALTSTATVSVYGLGGELGHLSARVLASSNPTEPVGVHITPLESRPDLRDCIECQQLTRSHAGNLVCEIHPVLEQGNVVGLMRHEHPSDATPPPDLINGLMCIYANQQSLLNHQQRDGLTGLYNRVALQNWLSKALSTPTDRRANDNAFLGCFALFDIDLFKRINDTKGHLYGDEVLLIFADLMRESFRFNDLLFRYGGEEFVAVLSDTNLDTALSVLERFRTTVSQHNFAQINQVTVTIGVARITPQMEPSKLIEHADQALYYGKNHGRNQVNAFEWLEQGHITSSVNKHPQCYKLF